MLVIAHYFPKFFMSHHPWLFKIKNYASYHGEYFHTIMLLSLSQDEIGVWIYGRIIIIIITNFTRAPLSSALDNLLCDAAS